MITLWDYTDTELPCADSNRSVHMKDMGNLGWELISVSSNPVNESHIYFWKRPIVDGISSALPIDNSRAETELHQPQEVAKEEVEANDPSTIHSHNFTQKISVSNYNKFPKPQIVMIVKYRPKEGCFAVFRDELYKRDYPNCIARHMGFNEQKEFVCVSFMESIDAALDLEGVGTSWLDSVDHLLIKYPNGSRTESFSGPVWGWYPSYENLRTFENDPKALTVIVVKMKRSAIQETMDLILKPSKIPNRFFSCIAQYKDTDDTYIHVSLDTLEDRIGIDKYFQIGHNKLLHPLVIREDSREFFSDPEDFVWFNEKYLQK